MSIAQAVAERSTCLKKHVGAILVKEGRIITTGYNGSLPGEPHCMDVGCLLNIDHKCVRTVHAEVNAILQGTIMGVSVAGSTMYATHPPCVNCSKFIKAVGIKEVNVYESPGLF